MVQQNAATRIRVAERPCRHPPSRRGDKKIRAFSSLLQSGQSVACKGIAQLKKTQDPLAFAIYSSKKVKKHQNWAAA